MAGSDADAAAGAAAPASAKPGGEAEAKPARAATQFAAPELIPEDEEATLDGRPERRNTAEVMESVKEKARQTRVLAEEREQSVTEQRKNAAREARAETSKDRASKTSVKYSVDSGSEGSDDEEWCGGESMPSKEVREATERLKPMEEGDEEAAEHNEHGSKERQGRKRGTAAQKRRTMAIMADRRSRLSKTAGISEGTPKGTPKQTSFAAKRRGAQSVLQSVSITELSETITDSSGVLVDYILRYKAKLAKQAKEAKKGGKTHEVQALSKFLNALSLNDWHGFEYAGEHISIEKLTTDIMTPVTKEAKQNGIWKRMNAKGEGGNTSSFAVMRARALQIREWKREEACLRNEVDNFILRYKLLHNKAVAMPEDMWERKARLEEFFADFHKKKEVPIDHESMAQVGSMQSWGPTVSRSALTSADDERGISRPRPPTTSEGSPRLGDASASAAGARAAAAGASKDGGELFGSPAGERFPRLPQGAPSPLQAGSPQGAPSPQDRRQQSRGGSLATPLARSKQSVQASSLPNLHGGANKYGSSKTFTATLWEMRAGPTRADKAQKLQSLKGHQKRYLQECDTLQRVPMPLAFVTGHSKKFEANGRDLVDQELIAMAGMLDDAAVIEDANLSGNSLLSDAGLVPFLQRLSRGPAVHTLQQLLLSSCLRAGVRTVEGVVRLLGRASSLQMLDLSHVPLNTRLQVQLCKGIGEHKALETINLADTGMASTYVSKQCIGELLGSTSLKNLDLSWNCFSSDTFLCLGEVLTKNSSLRSLKLTNCSATVEEGKDTPMSLFLECLSRDTSLVKLDVAMNRINHQTFLIIEDSLYGHPSMHELNVSNNPLGVHGIRSALRLMARDDNNITAIQLEGCFTGAMGAMRAGSEAVFSATSPGGRYVLFLDRACHRSLLRMLYRISDKFGLVPDDAFSSVAYTPTDASGKATGKPQPFSHPAKESNGVRAVPVSGKLELVLNMQRCIEKAISGLEDEDCDGFLTQYFEIVRYQPSWKKAIPIFANWKMIKQSMLQQQVFLDSLAKDFCLTVPRLAAMCTSNRLFAKDIVWKLMPCLPYDAASRFLGHMTVPSLGDFLWTHQRMQALLNFNAGNPTGHYKLNLDNCCDYAVADRLTLLDRWESAIDRRGQYFDTSKWGNKSHFRNELHRGHPILKDDIASMAEWTIPESGELEFDYTSNRRPRTRKATVSDSLWDHLLVSLYDAHSTLGGTALLQVVRRISHNICLTSMHMRKMLGYFKSEEERAECFVVFFFRIVDVCNAKIFSCRFSRQEEIVKLQERLGYVSFFPFVQPENLTFSLDFSQWDQRVCANLLVSLACKEKKENLRDPQYFQPDGSLDPIIQKQGVPASWQFLDKMPKSGRFECHYVCAPEDRKFEPRRRNAEIYGHYTVVTAEADVQWWTGLLEVPEDVLRLMEFIMSYYKNVDEVFTKLDGVDGNGEINFQEMVEGLRKIKFRKFEGKDERDRVQSVFRYLDPGGEGSISRKEWGILGQLWREFDLTVREFVQFMVIAFGGDLEQTWDILDPLGSGTLNLEQWMSAVEDIGFFGPAEIIYALLDSSDDGDISYEEFSKLWKYMPESVGNGSSDEDEDEDED